MVMAPGGGSASGANGAGGASDASGTRTEMRRRRTPTWKTIADDEVEVRRIVEHCGRSLKFASERLQDDRETVMLAARENPVALLYASERLRNDANFIYEIMVTWKKGAETFRFASERLRDDAQLAHVAVAMESEALSYASDRLRDDALFVRTAMQQKQDVFVLYYASERLRSDKEIALAAVQQDGFALSLVSGGLHDDTELMRTAIKTDERALEFGSERLRDDPDIILLAVASCGLMDPLMYTGDGLWHDVSLWRRAALLVHWEQARALLLLGRRGSDGMLPLLPDDVIENCLDILVCEEVAAVRQGLHPYRELVKIRGP